MPISFDVLRVGKHYVIKNHGEKHRFEVMEMGGGSIRIKDLDTLEHYELEELIRYGKGDDYDLFEADLE